MNINFEYYKIFYHVAKASSISAAARELCISQPAVSQAVKALEQAIGIELFIRTKKGVSLTNAGEILYSHVAAGYESISLGEQQLSQLLHMETGEISIGASDMTLQFYLLPYLEHFHQLYPGIKVHVTNAPTPSTINHLLSGNRLRYRHQSSSCRSSHGDQAGKGDRGHLHRRTKVLISSGQNSGLPRA